MPRKARTVPWIDIRGDNFYVAWYEPKERRTKRESLQTNDAQVATRRFADWLNRGQRRVSGSAEVTCDTVLACYLKEHSEKKCADHARNKFATVQLKRHFGALKPTEIDVPVCRAYVDLRQGDGVTISTIRRELATLAAAFKHAVMWKHMTLDMVPVLEMPQNQYVRLVGYWTKPELDRIRAAAQELADEKGGVYLRLPIFVDLAYYTASRRAAIETLTRGQVNLATGRINLAKDGERKTKKRRPIVPIVPEIRPLLEKALNATNSDFVLGSGGDNWRLFQDALTRAGLTGHAHMLRDSRATHLLQDGVDPYHVAALLGDSLSTVLRVYGHHCPDFLGTVLTQRKTGA